MADHPHEPPALLRPAVRLLKRCAIFAHRRTWWVLSLAALLTLVGGYLASKLTITTGTDAILSPDLAFRQIERAYREVFPSKEPVIVVIDAGSVEDATYAAAELARTLREGDADRLRDVALPPAASYFRRHALLFLDPERVRTVSEQLVEMGPMLDALAQDPNLRGVATVMGLLSAGAARDSIPPETEHLLTRLAETISARAEGRPATLAWGSLIDSAASRPPPRAIVIIDPQVDETSLQHAEAALAQIRRGIEAVAQAHPGVTMRLTGLPVLRQQELDDVFSGAMYASALSFVLVSLSLLLVRSWRLVAALIVTLIVGSVWTTGLAAISVGRLNLISVAFLVLFFGLGVDFGTHFGLRYLEERRKGASPLEAVATAAACESPGIALSALCAAIAFLSFLPTSYVGLAEFGIISSLGMLVAVIATFTVLPALMALMPPKPKSELDVGIGRWIARQHRGILILAIIVTTAAALVAPQIRMDVNPLNLQNPDAEPVQTYRDLADNPNTSPYALNAIEPNLEAAQSLAARLEKLRGVASVRTAQSFVPTEQEAKLAAIRSAADGLAPFMQTSIDRVRLDDDALRQAFAELRDFAAATASDVPQGSALAAAAARLNAAIERFADRRGTSPEALRDLDVALAGRLPRFLTQLQQQLSVTKPIALADLPRELHREWLAPDGRARVQVLPASDLESPEELDAFAKRVQAVAPNATGAPVGVSEAGEAVRNAFLQSILYTSIAIAVVVLILRRRLSDVVFVLAPLAVASLWTIAGAVAIGMPFNFANVIVIPLLIGLGVASSIHIVVRARQVSPAARGQDRAGVLDTSTPLAVLVAQLNTAAAFATLAVSKHQGLFSMGVLLGLAILFVLIASLVVLPAAMTFVGERRAGAAARASGRVREVHGGSQRDRMLRR